MVALEQPKSSMSQMYNLLIGLLGLLLGISLIVANKPVSRFIIRGQNNTWGFRFGEGAVVATRFVVVICGIIGVVFGAFVLALVLVGR